MTSDTAVGENRSLPEELKTPPLAAVALGLVSARDGIKDTVEAGTAELEGEFSRFHGIGVRIFKGLLSVSLRPPAFLTRTGILDPFWFLPRPSISWFFG